MKSLEESDGYSQNLDKNRVICIRFPALDSLLLDVEGIVDGKVQQECLQNGLGESPSRRDGAYRSLSGRGSSDLF